MKKKLSKELVIGISVIVAIAILIIGIDYLKGINIFKPANFYVASYDDVQGLTQSAPVQIDGFQVGQVREINFDYEKPGKIQVILALNKKLRLPDDSEAQIASSLLSGSYIEIKLGKSKRLIDVGGDIKTSRVPDMMSDLSNNIMPGISSLVPKIDLLLSNLNMLVSDPAIAQSIHRLDGITSNVLYASDDLRATMSDDLPFIMRSAGKITHNLDSITYNLAILSRDLKSLPLQPTMENVQRVTENLERFSAQLNNQESTLGKLTNDPELYNRINRVASDVDSLIVDIKRNPKRYISIKLL